jgi:hypothetical protein
MVLKKIYSSLKLIRHKPIEELEIYSSSEKHKTIKELERQEILNMFNSLTLEQLKKVINDLELFSLMRKEL